MLLYVFLVLGVWKGVTGNEDLCEEPEFRACETVNFGFPENEEDINRICPIVRERLNCLKNYFDTCGYNDKLPKDQFPKLLELVEDVCQEDSPLHLGIVQHIGCFNEVIDKDDESCLKSVRSASRKMSNYLREIEVERGYDQDWYDPELWLPLECIVRSYTFSCFVSRISERCGADAKDVATEILTRARVADHSCSVSSEESLAELLALLEFELEEEASIRTFIRRE